MRPKLSGIYISRLPERADSEFTRLQINAADGVGGLNAPPYWRMQGRGVSWIHADDNAPPCLRSACLIMAAGRYRRDGPGPWYAMACGTACVAFIGRDGPLWPAACPGLPQTPADWVSGYGLGRLRRAGTCDCGGVSVRGPAWSRWQSRSMLWSSVYRPGYCTRSCAAPHAPVYRESSTIQDPRFRRRLTTLHPSVTGDTGWSVIGSRCTHLQASFC